MRLTNKGYTLLEMLAVLVILGIIVMVMSNLFIHANRVMVKLNKTIQKAYGGTCYAPKTLQLSGTPVICFNGAKSDGCDTNHVCSFGAGGWARGGQACDAGVLLKGGCS